MNTKYILHSSRGESGFALLEVVIIMILVLSFSAVMARIGETMKIVRDSQHIAAIRLEVSRQFNELREICSSASTSIPYRTTEQVVVDGETITINKICDYPVGTSATDLVEIYIEATTHDGTKITEKESIMRETT